jgi:hypothetical protein
MADAMTLIGAVTLTSAQTTVTFANIPQTYRDLCFVFTGASSATDNLDLYLNGDTTNANYSRTNMRGDGASAASSNGTDAIISPLGTTNLTAQALVLDYSVSGKHRTTISRGSAASLLVSATAIRWANTAAVTSAMLKCDGGNTFAIGSTFYLYGVTA